MAAITKDGTPTMVTLAPPSNAKTMGHAGEAIAAGDACYIHADGTFMLATGAAANAAAKVRGFAGGAAAAGEPLTLFHNRVRFAYGANLTPGADLYLSGTVPGGLNTVASTGGTTPVAHVIDATRIEVY